MSKVLTIAVPAYNVEAYLDRCLSSLILDDRELMAKMEVIVVNDGSKDSTAEIAKKYCDEYPETFILVDKENGGHGSGINVGIERATGKYFKTLDGDDWFNNAEVAKFLQILEEQDADIVATDFEIVEDGTYKVIEQRKVTSEHDRYGRVSSFANGEVTEEIKMHSMTYKTSILQEHSIRLDEKCFYVDTEYIVYPIPFCENVYYDPQFIYEYRVGREGQSIDIRSMQKNKTQHEHVLAELVQFYQKACVTGMDHAKRKYIAAVIAKMVQNEFQIFISMGDRNEIVEEARLFDRELLVNAPDVYNAVTKKSIWMLRKTNYRLMRLAKMAYGIVKG